MIKFFEKAKEILPEERKYWADYLFHFTEMINAINILRYGKLYSRNKANELGLMKSDNAWQEVIEQTDPLVKEYVRFYFRPLTPTQHEVEGLKPCRPHDKHCPNPVFFLFGLDLLNQYPDERVFSEKTLASTLSIPYATKDVNILDTYNYQKIYHYGAYDKNVDSDIKQFRHAEFGVKDEVDLTNLKLIVTRSEAEKETLIYSLHFFGITKYDNIIKSCNEIGYGYMFYKKRFYIDKVVMADNFIAISAEHNHELYQIECYIKYDNKPEQEKLNISSVLTCYIPTEKYRYSYRIKVVVDGVSMYVGEHFKNLQTTIF